MPVSRVAGLMGAARRGVTFEVVEPKLKKKVEEFKAKLNFASRDYFREMRRQFRYLLLEREAAHRGGTSIPRPEGTAGKWSKDPTAPHLWDVVRDSISQAAMQSEGSEKAMGSEGVYRAQTKLLDQKTLDSYTVSWVTREKKPRGRIWRVAGTRMPQTKKGTPRKRGIPVWRLYEFGHRSSIARPRDEGKRLRIEGREGLIFPLKVSIPESSGFAPITKSLHELGGRLIGVAREALLTQGLKPKPGPRKKAPRVPWLEPGYGVPRGTPPGTVLYE